MTKQYSPALPNVSGKVFCLDGSIVETGIKSSRKSKRKRISLPIHRTQKAEIQRLINFLQPGTYIRPHKHPGQNGTESIVVIQGSIRFLIFDEVGFIENDFTLSAESTRSVMDIEPGVWHSFIALQEDTVVFEAKKGPYNQLKDKEFASWAPKEYTKEAEQWVEVLGKMQ